MEKDGFKPFKVKVPDNRRYWEDDTTGVVVKRGQEVEINQKDFRSSELKAALLRNYVLIVEGECEFAYKENIVKIKKGKESENSVTIVSGPDYDKIKKDNEAPKEPESVNQKTTKKITKSKGEDKKWQENQIMQP